MVVVWSIGIQPQARQHTSDQVAEHHVLLPHRGPRAAAAAASNSGGRGDGVGGSSSASPAASFVSVSVRGRDDSSVVATRTVSMIMNLTEIGHFEQSGIRSAAVDA